MGSFVESYVILQLDYYNNYKPTPYYGGPAALAVAQSLGH